MENVQVFLGQIEAWLLEPEIVDSFLNKNFNRPGCIRCESKKDPSKILLYGSSCLDVDSRMEIKYNLCTGDGREGLKGAFPFFTKTFKPVTQIEVKGAGEKAVNGTYTLAGMYDLVYFYTRSGLWEGKRVIFFLNRAQNTNRWSMYCKDESEILALFYCAEGTRKNYELPPLDAWGNEGNDFKGVDPPPQIFFKIDD